MTKARKGYRRRVRFSLRWKITLPFIFLAMLLGLGAAFLVNQVMSQMDEFHFLEDLADRGKRATDAVVRLERDLLELERLIANTEGIPQGVALQNAEELRARVLPLAINAGVDLAVVLDREALSLLTIRHHPEGSAGDYEILRGESIYKEWSIINQVLSGEDDAQGDKWVGLETLQVDQEDIRVFVLGAPLRDNQGAIIGAVLVGNYLENMLLQLQDEIGVNVSVYDLGTGALLGSSFQLEPTDRLVLEPSLVSEIMTKSDEQSIVRNVSIAGNSYREILARFEARNKTVNLGLLGIAKQDTQLQGAFFENVILVARYGAAALVLVVTIGLLISHTITRPLVEIAQASAQVAAGDLDTQVKTRSNDEIGLLAHSFNTLVRGLREGGAYAGAAQAPYINRSAQSDQAETMPGVRRGVRADATILVADMSNFLTVMGSDNPEAFMRAIDEWYRAVEPILSRYDGQISAFDGGTMVAAFGILPKQLSAQEGAVQAIHASVEIVDLVQNWNKHRSSKGLPAVELWLGLATGEVVAGGVGNSSQLKLVLIGDIVFEARSVQEICQEMGGGAILVSQSTYECLAEARQQFKFGRYGRARLRHSGQTVNVYEVQARRIGYISGEGGLGQNWTGEQKAPG
jgi:class 3 adenylate cyclase